MNYEETLQVLVNLRNNIMNKYGFGRNTVALEKAISLLQFINQNNIK